MTTVAGTTLLADDEIQDVCRCGPTPWPGRDLVVDAADDALVLTLKGHQYYRLAFQEHGVAIPLREVRTRTALDALSRAVRARLRQESRAQLAHSLHAGEIPSHFREWVQARVYGSPLRHKQALGRLVRNIKSGTTKKHPPNQGMS